MTDPTPAQKDEMLALVKRTHEWIDSLQIAGIEEMVIVPAMHLTLVERYLRAGGVAVTAEWLQSQADAIMVHGGDMLAELKRQGR